MRRIVERALLAGLLLGLAWLTYGYRRGFVKSFFVTSDGGAAAPVLPAGDGPPIGTTDRVRVVVLDGVDLDTARGLPNLNALCNRGLDLVVDVGFPTVSLPVQHVLWTGRTQQMSGVLFVARKLDPPPADALPAHVSGSVAVSEAVVDAAVSGGSRRGGPYQFIAQSFGFARVIPAAARDIPDGYTTGGFRRAAIDAVASDARLAFVHVLRTDTAAHKSGRDSEAFRDAAHWADQLLGELITADARASQTTTRWFVLSDHGHRRVGGHGGAEASIRLVRGCIVGDIEPAAAPPSLHLVDIHRALADSLGVRVPDALPGRPLGSALSAPPSPGATLPTPSPGARAIALLLLLVGVVITGFAARGVGWALPWWVAVACLSLLVIETAPTMSTKMTYAPRGKAVYMAALPGLCVLAITAALAVRRLGPARVVVAGLALPAMLVAAGRALCGPTPPLVPTWTAATSVALVVLWCACVVMALVMLVDLVQRSAEKSASD